MARPTKIQQAEKKRLLAEKAALLTDKQKSGGVSEPKMSDSSKAVKNAIFEPDIKALDAHLNESMNIMPASPADESEPITSPDQVSATNGTPVAETVTENIITDPIDTSDIKLTDAIHQIPDDDEIDEPLKGKVIERDYTKVTRPAQPAATDIYGQQQPYVEPVIPEQVINPTIMPPPANPGPQAGPQQQPAKLTQPGAPPKQPNPSIDPKLEDLNPTQKRKAAEKTADALLKTYKQVMPVIPRWLASYNIPKWQRAEMRGEINLAKEVSADGIKIKVIDYLRQTNASVEATYVVDDDMCKEIKESLVEVLMEKGYALSPTERLIMAIGQQFAMFAFSAFKQHQHNAAILDQFKKFHKDDIAAGREALKTSQQGEAPTQNYVHVDPDMHAAPPTSNPPPAAKQPTPSQQQSSPLSQKMKIDDVIIPERNDSILEEGAGFTMEEVINSN